MDLSIIYFGVGGILSISLGIFFIWLLKETEIDDATDLGIGLGLICTFIAWPLVVLFIIVEEFNWYYGK